MASLYAQKNLSTAQTDLASSVQKLSSGKRINSAKDDAAGYAVAEAVKATKNVTDQSIQNTQDAISLVQTAEGALDVVGKILQRVLTLVTEKENGTLTGTATTLQKGSINNEISSLLNEVAQINKRTKFQGGSVSIFGSTQTFTTGEGSTTTVGIDSLNLVDLGLNGSAATVSSVSTGTVTTSANHGFAVGDAVLYTGTGSSDLVTGQTYFVKTAATATTFTLAATSGGTALTFSAAPGTFKNGTTTQSGVDGLSSTTLMSAIQTNIESRAELGAWQNRLNYIVDNMQTLSNNLADAQSRIIDTDYASETAKLTRGQILQQAATSMLAQANQMPNVILTLLK
jgi:flagellin